MIIKDQESDSCTEEEEVEPKLKYVRLTNDLKKNILISDSVSCIAVHPKVSIKNIVLDICVYTLYAH